MATRIGLEPTTPSVTGWCSNQLSYRAMIAQVRAASYRGNVLYYIEKSACCQAQICRKCNFLQKQAGWAVWRRQNNFKWSPRCSDHIQRKDYFKFRVWSDRVCAAIKAPVGLLSGRAVLRSKMEGHCPDKLGGICDKGYHGLQGASRWFCKIYCDKAVIVGLMKSEV